MLARCYAASIGYRTAFGERARHSLRRLGTFRFTAANNLALGPCRARFDGFDLHADTAVPARDRARLERLCRYVARPAVSHQRLERRPDGTIALRLKAPWSDGTEQVLFEPLELLEKLAVLVPRPRTNLVLYHGVLAPNANWRRRLVRYGRDASRATPHVSRSQGTDAATGATPPPAADPSSVVKSRSTRRRLRWADLMRRAFGLDVLACPRCGGKLILLASITHSPTIAAILRSMNLDAHLPEPAPARAPPDDGPSSNPRVTDDLDFDLGA